MSWCDIFFFAHSNLNYAFPRRVPTLWAVGTFLHFKEEEKNVCFIYKLSNFHGKNDWFGLLLRTPLPDYTNRSINDTHSDSITHTTHNLYVNFNLQAILSDHLDLNLDVVTCTMNDRYIYEHRAMWMRKRVSNIHVKCRRYRCVVGIGNRVSYNLEKKQSDMMMGITTVNTPCQLVGVFFYPIDVRKIHHSELAAKFAKFCQPKIEWSGWRKIIEYDVWK